MPVILAHGEITLATTDCFKRSLTIRPVGWSSDIRIFRNDEANELFLPDRFVFRANNPATNKLKYGGSVL